MNGPGRPRKYPVELMEQALAYLNDGYTQQEAEFFTGVPRDSIAQYKKKKLYEKFNIKSDPNRKQEREELKAG
jgi:hypothetical protein